MKKNYDTKILKPGFSSGLTTETKVLIAKITLIVCILIMIAAKSFGQCNYNAQEISPACVSVCNGVVEITASGGTPPYFLNISGGPQVTFTSNYQWTTACGGWQNYAVTDALGNCAYTGTVLVNSVSPFSATVAAAGPTTFCYGNSVTLNASPAGGSYTYQWRKNGNNISGAVASSFMANSAGNYDVVISNGCVSTSNVITVTVTNLSVLSMQPNAANGMDMTIHSIPAQQSMNVTDLNAMAWTFSGTPGVMRGLIRFDLSSIPVNAIVVNASLYLYNNPTSGNGNPTGQHSSLSGSNAAWLQRVTSPWSESTVVWSNQPTSTTANQVVIPQSTSVHQNYVLDVSTHVQDMVTSPAANFGFMLRLQTESYYRLLLFASSDCADSTKWPKIVVEYVVPVTASITASGATTFCSPGSVTLNANTGSGFIYQWRLNELNISGATTSSYSAAASGNYDCVVSNTCGSAASNVITVTANSVPSTPASITGQAGGVCGATGTYSVAAVPFATTYNWTVPAGATIASGQGTTSINVSFISTFISGNIFVNASNSCGTSGASNRTVTGIPAQPGPISGPTSVCQNQNNVIYSIAPVPGATSYTWTKPPGAVFNSGQGTTSVNIRFGKKSGTVTVKANRSCGSSAVRSLSVAMPCRIEAYDISETELDVNIFPNPSPNDFTFVINSSENNSCSINIFDLTGRVVEVHQDISADKEFKCGARLTDGIYYAEIISGYCKKVLKLVKQR